MKNLIKIIVLFLSVITLISPTLAGDLQCRDNSYQKSKIDRWSSQGLQVTCMLNRENYKCDEFENNLLSESKNDFQTEIDDAVDLTEKKNLEAEMLKEEKAIKNRFNRCGASSSQKDAEETSCIVNGVKIAFKSLTEIPGEIVKFFKDAENCHKDLDQKKKMIELFNLSVEDQRYTMDFNNIKDWTCGQIEMQLRSRYHAYQKNIYDQRVRDITAGKKPSPLKSNNTSDIPNLKKIFDTVMESSEVRYQCYTREYKAKVICETLVSIPAEFAMTLGAGFVAKATISGVTKAAKSARALDRVTKSIKKGEKISLFDASKLTEKDRLKAAEGLLTKKLSLDEQKAILEAHNIGLKEGRGFFSYTQDDILKKTRLLREAGFDKEQVRKLMENGITGMSPDDEFFRPMFTTLQKTMGGSPLNFNQKEALLYAHAGNGMSVEKKAEMLAKAGLTPDQIKKYFDHKKAMNQASVNPTKPVTLSGANVQKPATVTTPTVKPVPVVTQTKPTTQNPATLPAKSDWSKKIESGFNNDAVYNFQVGASKEKVEAAVKDITRRLGDFDPVRQIQDDISEIYKHKKMMEEAQEKMKTASPNSKNFQEAQVQIEKSEAYTKVYKQRCQNWYELQKAKYNFTEKIEPYLKRCMGI